MGFSRQEYWCGLPSPPAGDLPDPEIELVSLALQADSFLLSHQGSPFLRGEICHFYTLTFLGYINVDVDLNLDIDMDIDLALSHCTANHSHIFQGTEFNSDVVIFYPGAP